MAHVDQAPQTVDLPATAAVAATVFSCVCSDPTLRPFTASRQYVNDSGTVSDNEQISLGVAIDGSNPQGDLEDINAMAIMVQVSGAIRVRKLTGANALNGHIVANVGRNNAATVVGISSENACTNYMQIPIIQQLNSANVISASINTCVIIGNFDAGITYTGFPLLFGWTILNQAGEDQTWGLQASMSVMKVVKPQHLFDLRST